MAESHFELPIKYNELTALEKKLVRKQYMKEQKGLCFFCKTTLSKPPLEIIRHYEVTRILFPKNFFEYPVHLHHSHDTGLTIGAVHAYCNAVLWQYYRE